MRTALLFLARRTAAALVLVLAAASAAMLLSRMAPGDHLSSFTDDPAFVRAERQRLGLDRPLAVQYVRWVGGLLRLDLGESTAHPGQPVASLIASRAANSLLLGLPALIVASLVGLPAGVVTGSRPRTAGAVALQATSMVTMAVPPMVWSLALLVVAARTGWFPVGGLPDSRSAGETVRSLVLPVLALAIPLAAALERLQSRAMADAVAHPSVAAARARGIPPRRVIWRHAFRLSLRPVLGVYGVMLGALISGSFVVEYVMTWPGLGRLMYDGLVTRDANLVAGCAAAGAACLAAGILVADVVLALVDPRAEVGA